MDRLNLYPTTSCPCEEIPKDMKLPEGARGSLSVRGCSVPEYFNYQDRLLLSQEIQPREDTGKYELNPQSIMNKLAPDFHQVACCTPGCPQPSWITWDPRLSSTTRGGDYLPLDTVPTTGRVRLKNMYNDGYTYDHATNFENYENIGDGNITYYIDKEIQDPFYKPVFSEPAKESSVLFVDPMGSVKLECNREALINTENPTVTKAKFYPYCLSSMQDSASFREDLMALQMRKINQERWSNRWAKN